MLKNSLSQNKELANALRIIWLISGIVSLIIILVTFFVPSDFVLKNMPTCDYSALNKTCFLCGTTRAFLEIKELNFAQAYKLNKLSLFLFFLMIINILLIITNLKNTIKKL